MTTDNDDGQQHTLNLSYYLITPCTQVGHPHTHNRPGLQKNKNKKRESISSGSAVQLDLLTVTGCIKGSPRYCWIAHHLALLWVYFFSTSRALEEQHQSRRNHRGGDWGKAGYRQHWMIHLAPIDLLVRAAHPPLIKAEGRE